MKIKFRPLGLPFWGHRRADYMFTAGIGVGRQAVFMGRGRDSLFEQHSRAKQEWQHETHLMLTDLKPHGRKLLRSANQLELSPLRNHDVAQCTCLLRHASSLTSLITCSSTTSASCNFSIYKAVTTAKRTTSILEDRKAGFCNTKVEGHEMMPKLSWKRVLWGNLMTQNGSVVAALAMVLMASMLVDCKYGLNSVPFLCNVTLPYMRYSVFPSS